MGVQGTGWNTSKLLLSSVRRSVISVGLVFTASAVYAITPAVQGRSGLFAALAVAFFIVCVGFSREKGPTYLGRVHWVFSSSNFRLRSFFLQQRARQIRTSAISALLRGLQSSRDRICTEFGLELFTHLRHPVLVIVDESNPLGGLIFADALKAVGFHVTVKHDYGEIWVLGYLGHLQQFDLIFGGERVRLVSTLDSYVSLNGLAAGDVNSWASVLHRLDASLLPPGADLALRDYFRLATSLIRIPPEHATARFYSAVTR